MMECTELLNGQCHTHTHTHAHGEYFCWFPIISDMEIRNAAFDILSTFKTIQHTLLGYMYIVYP